MSNVFNWIQHFPYAKNKHNMWEITIFLLLNFNIQILIRLYSSKRDSWSSNLFFFFFSILSRFVLQQHVSKFSSINFLSMSFWSVITSNRIWYPWSLVWFHHIASNTPTTSYTTRNTTLCCRGRVSTPILLETNSKFK